MSETLTQDDLNDLADFDEMLRLDRKLMSVQILPCERSKGGYAIWLHFQGKKCLINLFMQLKDARYFALHIATSLEIDLVDETL